MNPGELIERADQIQHTLELTERARWLDRAAELLADPDPDWSQAWVATWRCRIQAERAMDLARCEELDAAQQLAQEAVATAATIVAGDPTLSAAGLHAGTGV